MGQPVVTVAPLPVEVGVVVPAVLVEPMSVEQVALAGLVQSTSSLGKHRVLSYALRA